MTTKQGKKVEEEGIVKWNLNDGFRQMCSIIKKNWSVTFPKYKSEIAISKNTNLMQDRKTALIFFLYSNYDLSWGYPVLPCSRGCHDDTSSSIWNCHFRLSSYIIDAPESWATDFTDLRMKPLGLSTVATHHRSNTNWRFLAARDTKVHC